MKNTLKQDFDRLVDEHWHLLQASKDAIDLLTRHDAPNLIKRQERLELAQQWLEMAVRYAEGGVKNEIWNC